MALCLGLMTSAARAQPQPQPQQEAPDPEALLQQAEKYYEQLEYESALKTLIMVHQVPGSTDMQKARSFLYMGVCFTALGNAENAVLAFVELLKLKANFRLPPGISPSIKAMFTEALRRLKMPEQGAPEPEQGGGGASPDGGGGGGGGGGEPSSKIPVSVKAKAPGQAVAGSSIEVTIEVSDPRKLVKGLSMRWRRVGGGDYSTVKVPYPEGARAVSAQIPGALVGKEKGKILFFVEALGRGGMTLAHAGAMDEPLRVKLTEAPQKTSKWAWWAIGIGGALAVAGGVVAAVLLTQDDTPAAPVTDVTLTVH